MKIPSKIHYCWFGGKPLPPLAQRCIASWQKFLPGYEIIRWDESNFDINICSYVQEAYQAKKWAFVSDYVRFAVLYKYGGLYFDTDVEIIKPLDIILARGGFMGLETDCNQKITANPGLGMAVAPGLGMAVAPGLGLYKEILDAYHTRHFIKSDGSLNVTTVVTYTTEILKKHGLKNVTGIQHVAGVNIYPTDYFCPKNYLTGELKITSNTVTVHHFEASWVADNVKYAHALTQRLNRFLPYYLALHLADFIATWQFYGFNQTCIKLINKLVNKLHC